jgi:hypothetical protein
MPALALSMRLVLAWASGLVVVIAPLAGSSLAWAQDDEEEDEGDDGGDESGDGGDEDEGDGGSDDSVEEDDEDEGEEGEGEEDEGQPLVTAGGLFTKKNYPVGENLRPLILNKGMIEAKAGFNMDMNALHAFETWRLPIEARYGLRDHVELQFGADFLLVYNEDDKETYEAEGQPLLPSFDNAVFSLGVESALYYNVVDFRIALEFPINPGAEGGEPADNPEFGDGLDPPSAFTVDIVVGVPFRIVPKKQFAIFALDKIFTVHTLSGSKPDLNAALGVVIMPVDIVSIVLRGEFVVPEFNTNFLLIPASAAVQFSPNNKFDLGLEFTFASLKLSKADEAFNESNANEDDDLSAFSRRFLQLFVQARF